MESRLLARRTQSSEPHRNRKASHPFYSCVRSIRYNRDLSQPSAPSVLVVLPTLCSKQNCGFGSNVFYLYRVIYKALASKGSSVGFSDSVPVLKSPTAHLLISRRRLPASGHK